MRQTIIGVALCVMLAVVLYTRQQPASSGVHERQFLAMGTLVSVTIAENPALSDDQVIAAINDVEAAMHAFDRRWHPDGDGELAQVNAALAEGRAATPGVEMRREIDRAIRLSQQSRGLFDPGIGDLIALWRFDSEDNYPEQPPPESQIDALVRAQPGIRGLALNADAITVEAPLRLDFGAYAKGLALAEAMQILKSHGINDAIVTAGGDLLAIGKRGERAWRIGIRHPRATESGQRILAAIEPQDEAVVTSGDYERFFESQGRRYHHVLDPRSGYPAEGTRSLTVVHSDAALADAASTALFVAGAEHWLPLARELGVDAVMRVDQSGRIEITEALAGRLTFPGGDPEDLRVIR